MIEEKLERIATALEKIAEHLGPEVIIKEVEEVKTQEEIVKSVVPTPPPVPAAPVIQISLEELDVELNKEYERLGEDRTKIDNAIKKHGAQTLSALDPAMYSQLLEDVRTIER